MLTRTVRNPRHPKVDELLRDQARCSHVGLLGELNFLDALKGSNHVLVLDTHNTTAPVSAELIVVVELLTEVGRKSLKVLEVFLVDFGQSNSGSSLHVNELAEVGLAADKAVRNVLSSAEGGQVNNSLNWINVVGDHNQLGLAFLNEGSHMVEAELNVDGLGGLAGTTVLGGLLETELLFLLGLGLVLTEQLEEFGG